MKITSPLAGCAAFKFRNSGALRAERYRRAKRPLSKLVEIREYNRALVNDAAVVFHNGTLSRGTEFRPASRAVARLRCKSRTGVESLAENGGAEIRIEETVVRG